MAKSTTRFPRVALWHAAAKLQQELELWCGNTAVAIEALENNPTTPAAHRKLYDRYQGLKEARELATDLRTLLYGSE
jgi:hypothetical protein